MPNDAAALKSHLPILARNEGVWDGMYRRYDSEGSLMAEFASRVIMRFRDGVPEQEMYHQTNLYRFSSGQGQVIESTGWFDGEGLHFGSDRDISGWAADDVTDIHGNTCLLYMAVHSATSQLAAGTLCYELVNLSSCGRYRARAAQYMHDGRLVMRTLIDEECVSRDWAGDTDWVADFEKGA